MLLQTKGTMQSISQTPREIAKWDAAVQALQSEGYINLTRSTTGTSIYQVTDKGFKHSDGFKDTHHLDTNKIPTETLADLHNHYRQQDEEQERETQAPQGYLFYDPYHRGQ